MIAEINIYFHHDFVQETIYYKYLVIRTSYHNSSMNRSCCDVHALLKFIIRLDRKQRELEQKKKRKTERK